MASIRVLALVSVMGMVRGQEYVLNANSTVDALIDRGMVKWIDQPEPSEIAFDLTPEVQKRAATNKKPAVEKAVRQNPAPPSNEIVPPKVKPSPKRNDEDVAAEEALENEGAPLSAWSEDKRKLDVQSGPEFYAGE